MSTVSPYTRLPERPTSTTAQHPEPYPSDGPRIFTAPDVTPTETDHGQTNKSHDSTATDPKLALNPSAAETTPDSSFLASVFPGAVMAHSPSSTTKTKNTIPKQLRPPARHRRKLDWHLPLRNRTSKVDSHPDDRSRLRRASDWIRPSQLALQGLTRVQNRLYERSTNPRARYEAMSKDQKNAWRGVDGLAAIALIGTIAFKVGREVAASKFGHDFNLTVGNPLHNLFDNAPSSNGSTAGHTVTHDIGSDQGPSRTMSNGNSQPANLQTLTVDAYGSKPHGNDSYTHIAENLMQREGISPNQNPNMTGQIINSLMGENNAHSSVLHTGQIVHTNNSENLIHTLSGQQSSPVNQAPTFNTSSIDNHTGHNLDIQNVSATDVSSGANWSQTLDQLHVPQNMQADLLNRSAADLVQNGSAYWGPTHDLRQYLPPSDAAHHHYLQTHTLQILNTHYGQLIDEANKKTKNAN